MFIKPEFLAADTTGENADSLYKRALFIDKKNLYSFMEEFFAKFDFVFSYFRPDTNELSNTSALVDSKSSLVLSFGLES